MATVNQVNALFKRVWGDGAIKALPRFSKIMEEVPYSKRERLGDVYVVPVVLAFEHGFSYGAYLDGAFALNAAIAGKIIQAQINGNMIVLRTQLSYEDVFKAAEAGAAAFESATSMVVENMQRSFAKRQELSFLYGQCSLAKVSAIASHVITVTDLTWAPGMWSGMVNCTLDSTTSVAATTTVHDTAMVISSVNVAQKKITVTGDSATVANDFLWFAGAKTSTAFKECAGLFAILANTSTLFNIDAGTWELWKAQQYAVNGPISMLAIMNGLATAQNFGLDEDGKAYFATKRWNYLNADQAALRRYGAYAAKAENGSEGIAYHSVNGQVEIVAHPFVKEGDGGFFPNPKKRLMRVGATDITFRRPGLQENIFRELVDNAGFELRAFSDQAIMATLPAQCVQYTGITD